MATRTLASVPGLEHTIEHTVRLETREGWRLDDYALVVPDQPTVMPRSPLAESRPAPEPCDAVLVAVIAAWCLLAWTGLATVIVTAWRWLA